MKWKTRELGDFALIRGGSVNPAKHLDEVFELLSIPAFDAGTADVCLGKEIGSSKKCVEPNDVLISKIVPHIRRCWVVPEKAEHRQIASSEWIQFRTTELLPDFLRHFLTSDPFHRRFMQTISGVGGSLLRARPTEVYKIKIPVPPAEEQKRIAAILDAVDELRTKRRESLVQLDALLQSTFLNMFGDPAFNPKDWEVTELADVVAQGDRINYGVVQPGDDIEGGCPLIRVGDFISGELDLSNIKCIDPNIDKKYSRSKLNGSEVLISCVGSIGNICKAPTEAIGHNIARAVARVPLAANVDRDFVVQALRSNWVQDYFSKETRTVSQPTLNISLIKKTPIFLPPLSSQRQFSNFVQEAEKHWGNYRVQAVELDALFSSLQSLAFSGGL